MSEKKLTVSVPEAGRMLGIGRDAAYAAARRGELPVMNFGRLKRVPVAAIERMIGTTITPPKSDDAA